MEKSELILKYGVIEKKIEPIKDFLEANKNSKEYKGFYKGIITLQSPLVYKPYILFIGINSGDGAYNVCNGGDHAKNETPLRMLDHDTRCFQSLNWYEEGNARGCFIKENGRKRWMSYKWYQRDKRINNRFPKNLIDLLYETAKLKYPEEYNHQKYNNKQEPFWYIGFGQRIMSTNLYPIATTNVRDLNKIHDALARETTLKSFWDEYKHNGEPLNNWVVRKYFIKRVEELIKLVQPQVIVCLGMAAFNDFAVPKYKENGAKIFTHSKKVGDINYPVIGFSRRGQWSGLIPEIAKKIELHMTN